MFTMANGLEKEPALSDLKKEEMIDLLIRWSNINSFSDNLPGLEKMLSSLQGAFSSLGGKVEVKELAPRGFISTKGEYIEVPHGKALRVSKRSDAPIQILFSGHMDTVFEKDHSFQTARITDKNCLQGPGVADMKGGLVIMLKALELFERHPISKNIGWEIIISPDEEVGSLGSKPLLFEAIKNKDIGLIFEPSFPDGSLVSSRKGSANFTVTSKGKAAHAGRNFYEGSNAIVTLAAFITEVQKLNDPKHDLTVNIGQISGGGAINIVPNFSLCHINARASTKEDFEKIPIYLQSIINKVNRDGGDLNLFIHHQNYPKPFDYKNQQLFSFLKACAGSLNQDLKWKPSGGTCDGNFLSCQGLPVIDSLGAIGGNIHTEHEYIFIDSLEIRIRLLTTFLLQIASGIFKEIKHLRENYAPST